MEAYSRVAYLEMGGLFGDGGLIRQFTVFIRYDSPNHFNAPSQTGIQCSTL